MNIVEQFYCVFAASIERDGLNTDLGLTEDEFLDKFHLPPVTDTVEKAKRAEVLHQHQLKVQEVNDAYIAGNKTWYDKINKFSDIPDDEFIRTHTGLIEKSDESRRYDEKSERFFDAYRYSRQDTVPASINSVNLGLVSPVKDQGNCGSCVAFATLAVAETCFKRITGTFGDYSEQQLLDCAYNPRRKVWGCGGADAINAYARWLLGKVKPNKQRPTPFNGNLASEAGYPYTAKVETCRFDYEVLDQGAKVSRQQYYWNRKGDEETLKRLVAEQGAVIISVHVNSEFQSYAGGVFSGCSKGRLNHAVAVVGYGSEDGVDYWLVKNSWGEDWGDEGFIKMQRGVGMCGIGKEIAALECEDQSGSTPPPVSTLPTPPTDGK